MDDSNELEAALVLRSTMFRLLRDRQWADVRKLGAPAFSNSVGDGDVERFCTEMMELKSWPQNDSENNAVPFRDLDGGWNFFIGFLVFEFSSAFELTAIFHLDGSSLP